MKRLVLASLLVLGFAWPALAATTSEPRVALVIGNSAYATSPLKNPANDARLIAETLRALGFQVIEQIDANQKGMRRLLRDFGEALSDAGPDSVGLFYYSGHGVQVRGENFLIPTDAAIERESDVKIEAVSANEVLNTLSFADNRLNIVILDACRNNPYASAFKSPGRGLARMDAPRGTMVAYATAPGQVARDGEGTNSPYTAALAAEMWKRGVPVEQMFKQVRVAVMGATKDKQVPWESSSLTGSFYFNPAGVAAAPAPTTPSPDTAATQQETVFWQSIEDSSDPADFEAYLMRYPSGAFVALARNRLNKLWETETAAVVPPPKPAGEAVQPVVGVYPKAFKPGETFKDCEACPEMVVIPAGAFTMGSPASEKGRWPNEGPQHRVTIGQAFALGKYEVTFAEWDACVAGGGCNGYRPKDIGRWGRGRRPVIYVSWKDAKAYVAWLSRKTGKGYRLPSEAEWEYAARAGTTTPFHFGPTISSDRANYNRANYKGNWRGGTQAGRPIRVESEYSDVGKSKKTYGGGRKGVNRHKTVPVGSFPSNAFGLHDVHGNVWEWVEDCFNYGYSGAPNDGSAWTREYCGEFGYRGGSWVYGLELVRAARRSSGKADYRYLDLGFRVARTLP